MYRSLTVVTSQQFDRRAQGRFANCPCCAFAQNDRIRGRLGEHFWTSSIARETHLTPGGHVLPFLGWVL